MKTAYVIAGRLPPQGTLELDEYPPLPPGPVRVSVEAALGPAESLGAAVGEELSNRKAQMAAAIGCLSDEDAQQMLDVIEAEFEGVDLGTRPLRTASGSGHRVSATAPSS